MLDVGAVDPAAVTTVHKFCKALLDSGCLVGDCMSQHLVVNIYTTICSGFDNHCSNTFPSLLINISFLNETNALVESFLTRVIILPKSPIEIIIGRKTIQTLKFSKRTPSHFDGTKNLTVPRVTMESFGNALQEKCGYTVSNQNYVERSSSVKVHPHKCLSILNPDTNSVRNETTLVKFKTSKEAPMHSCSQCLCSKTLLRGSCKEGTNLP